MSEAFYDLSSWKRAMNPALRAFGYLTAVYVIIFLIFVALPYFLVQGLGLSSVIGTVAGWISSVLFVFAIFLVFFKVVDEDRPGQIQLL